MRSVLFLALPTQPGVLRLRLWRALKTRGCRSMRELSTRDAAHRAAVLALVDRTRPAGSGAGEAQSLTAALPAPELGTALRRWRGTAEALQSIRLINCCAGTAAEQAQAELDTRCAAVDARCSRGEPAGHAPPGVPRPDIRKFRGKRGGDARPAVGWPPGRRVVDPPLHRPTGSDSGGGVRRDPRRA